MSYEIFTRKIRRTGTPMMSFSKMGHLVFNQSASAIFQKDAIEYVLLMWDSSEKKMAIKSTNNKKDDRAYRLHFAPKGNGAAFSAKTFFDYIGIDYSDRKAIQINIDPNKEYIVEVKLPDAFFKGKTVQPRTTEKRKSG